MMREIADEFVDELKKMLPKEKGKDGKGKGKGKDGSDSDTGSGDSTSRAAAGVARQAAKAAPKKDLPAPKSGDVYVHVHVAGNLIGEKDFAKRVTPTVRDELAKIKKRNNGKLFGDE
jgi:hypothetical protein